MPAKGDMFEVQQREYDSEEAPETEGFENALEECCCPVRSHDGLDEWGSNCADYATEGAMKVSFYTEAE